MNQESIVHKVKEIVHSLKDKIRHDHKNSVESELNEYDKMRVETLLKREMDNKLDKGHWVPEKMKPDKGNNRDISAI